MTATLSRKAMPRNQSKAYLNKDSGEFPDLMFVEPQPSHDSQVLSPDESMTAIDKLMTSDDIAVVTFKQIGEALDEKPNTISARWFPLKIVPVYEGRQCPSLYVVQGDKLKPTGFGAKAIACYVQQCVRGSRSWESWKNEVHEAYPELEIAVVDAELLPESLSSTAITEYRRQRSEQDSEDLEESIAALANLSREVKSLEEEFEESEQERLDKEALKRAVARKQKELQAKKREAEAEARADKLLQKLLNSLE